MLVATADPGGRTTKAYVYRRLIPGITAPNPAEGMDVCV